MDAIHLDTEEFNAPEDYEDLVGDQDDSGKLHLFREVDESYDELNQLYDSFYVLSEQIWYAEDISSGQSNAVMLTRLDRERTTTITESWFEESFHRFTPLDEVTL